MTPNERIAYIKGLIEGAELKLDDKQRKILDEFVGVVADLAEQCNETAADVDELYERTDDLYDCVDDIEEYLSDEDEDDDDYMYDVECPNCGEKICVSEETLLEGDMVCPSCGEKLELEFDCDCDECGDDCECDDHCSCGDKDEK